MKLGEIVVFNAVINHFWPRKESGIISVVPSQYLLVQ